MRIVIAGGGIAGLCAALVLGRAGHEVVVVERDRDLSSRSGVPQYLQPHVLLALGCCELAQHTPDVYAEMVAGGAADVDMNHRRLPHNPDMRALGFRRELLERVLRQAVAAESTVTVHYGGIVRGVAADGLDTRDGVLPGDLIIDALGRTSSLTQWPKTTATCGMAYYSRYFRLRDDNPIRQGNVPTPVRLDIGLADASLFWAEDRHIALIFTVPMDNRDLHQLRHEAAFTRVAAMIPSMTPYIGPDAADPVTPVRFMSNAQSSLREPTPGFVSIGDAMCHTNPLYGWGMSLAMTQAFSLPGLVATPERFYEQHAAQVRDRFEVAVAMDSVTGQLWSGKQIDFLGPDADPTLFRTRGLGAAGILRPDIQQRLWRWIGILDPAAVLDSDVELHEEANTAARAVLTSLTPPVVPTQSEVVAALNAGEGFPPGLD